MRHVLLIALCFSCAACERAGQEPQLQPAANAPLSAIVAVAPPLTGSSSGGGTSSGATGSSGSGALPPLRRCAPDARISTPDSNTSQCGATP